MATMDSAPATMATKRPLDDSTEPLLPAPKFFKVRAHSNPLAESVALAAHVPATPAEMDWSPLYPRWIDAPAAAVPTGRRVEWVDIGCGFGGLVASLAQQFPEVTILGMEIRDKVSAAAMDRILQLRAAAGDAAAGGAAAPSAPTFENVAVLRSNCMRSLQQFFAKGQLTKVCFCFPDPHFQAHSHRRRVISRGLLATYAYILREGGLMYTVTDVIDLHEWHVRHIEEHALFERLPPAEETPEHDPVVAAITRRTDESVKVAKVQGDVFVAVFRRVPDSALAVAGGSAFEASRQSAAARILTAARVTGQLLQSAAGVPCPTSLADARAIQAASLRGGGVPFGWRAGESSLTQPLATRLPPAPIFRSGVATATEQPGGVFGAASRSPVVLCKIRQNITRLVPHIAIHFRDGPSRIGISPPGSIGVDDIWEQVDGWGLALEAVGARHTCELEDQSAEAAYWQRITDGGGSVSVAVGQIHQKSAVVSRPEQEEGVLYCDLDPGGGGEVRRSAITLASVVASALAVITYAREAQLDVGSMLLVPVGTGTCSFAAGGTVTARLSSSGSGGSAGVMAEGQASDATISLESSEVLAVTRRHAYAREVRPKIVRGVDQRSRVDIPAALGGSETGAKGTKPAAAGGEDGAEQTATDTGTGVGGEEAPSGVTLALLVGYSHDKSAPDPALQAAGIVANALRRELSAKKITDDELSVKVIGRGTSSEAAAAAVCEVVAVRVTGAGAIVTGGSSLTLGDISLDTLPDIHHGGTGGGAPKEPKSKSKFKQKKRAGPESSEAPCKSLAAVCDQDQAMGGERAQKIFSVCGSAQNDRFDPATECLREEYEYLLPASCCIDESATAGLATAAGRRGISVEAERWTMQGAGELAAGRLSYHPVAHTLQQHGDGTALHDDDVLHWELIELGKGPGSETALLSTKLEVEAVGGGSLEWCVSRGAACDVRVRLVVRQAGQPAGEWWVSREASYPMALLDEEGQFEVKSQAIFGATDTWQVLRTNPGAASVEASQVKRGPGEGGGKGQRGFKGGQKKGGMKPQGKAVGLRSDWGGVTEVGWLVDGEAGGASLALKQLTVIAGGSDGGSRPGLALLPRLTALLRCFDGSPRLHNYTDGASATDRSTHAQGVRCRNHGLLTLKNKRELETAKEDARAGRPITAASDEDFIVVSLAAPRFLSGQICRIVGAIAALLSSGSSPPAATGEVTYIEATLQPDCVAAVLDGVCVPPELLYLTECKFKRWGGNRARRMGQGPAVSRAIVAWRAALQCKLAFGATPGHGEAWRDMQSLWGGWRAARSGVVAAKSQLLEDVVPEGWLDARFRAVLARLRQMTSAGGWPATPESRAHIFVDRGAAAGGAPAARSITLTADAAGSLGLTDLWEAAAELEAALSPERPASGSVTVNSHAQFRPHTDHAAVSEVPAEEGLSGTGAEVGVERTLIVGVGAYTGGEYVVEGTVYDIRYTPLSHDGVAEKHWTAPFEGERYTLVWA